MPHVRTIDHGFSHSVPQQCGSSCPVTLLNLLQNYEPDELTKEMAHLEGLMKDLNAITTA